VRRVLLIEDNDSVSISTAAILESDGYHVVVAATIASATRAMADSSFDVVILDRELPDGRGEDLLPEIRRRFPLAFVIVSSGDTRGGKPQGADHTMAKGEAPSELLRVLGTSST
jgi:DNA-binding response OmpR family regulator